MSNVAKKTYPRRNKNRCQEDSLAAEQPNEDQKSLSDVVDDEIQD